MSELKLTPMPYMEFEPRISRIPDQRRTNRLRYRRSALTNKLRIFFYKKKVHDLSGGAIIVAFKRLSSVGDDVVALGELRKVRSLRCASYVNCDALLSAIPIVSCQPQRSLKSAVDMEAVTIQLLTNEQVGLLELDTRQTTHTLPKRQALLALCPTANVSVNKVNLKKNVGASPIWGTRGCGFESRHRLTAMLISFGNAVKRVMYARLAADKKPRGLEYPQENPLTSGIVRHDSHMRKSGNDPDWTEDYTTCIQVDPKPGFEKCSFYREQSITGALDLNIGYLRLYTESMLCGLASLPCGIQNKTRAKTDFPGNGFNLKGSSTVVTSKNLCCVKGFVFRAQRIGTPIRALPGTRLQDPTHRKRKLQVVQSFVHRGIGTGSFRFYSSSITCWLYSIVLCTLVPQMFVHWLLLQRVASVTSHLAEWHSLLVSLQACYWLRVVQGMNASLELSCLKERDCTEVKFSFNLTAPYRDGKLVSSITIFTMGGVLKRTKPTRMKRDEYGAAPECKGEGKGEIPEETRRLQRHHPARFPHAITRGGGATPPGIQPGSPGWEASSLTTTPRQPHMKEECSSVHSGLMFVHWLLLQRVASGTSHLAEWYSLLVSLQACYWLRVVQGVSNEL
ncbi:hypothetical protein PR048_003210 [Dryococelus australis]|uniref:Uncharacterized protein n=1 Tax=Dryococelus australis TaxID=614101 RepID=A0ABQ9IMG7_9NEOP|nr:hypothetical protein PR048_003210 [Dryococelus australis]